MLRLAMVIGVWVLISGGTYGWAEAGCDADIVRTWQMDRDSAVIRLLKGWLNGQPTEALHPHILTLTRSEVFLHTCAPAGEQPDGYLSHLPQVTLDQVPSAVFMRYLKQHGIDLSPAGFFAGKRFHLLVPTDR